MVVIIFKHSMVLLLTFSAVIVLFSQPMVLSLTFSMVVVLFSQSLGGEGGVITHLLHGDGFIWMVLLLTFSTVMVLPCSSLLLRHSMHLSASTTVDMVTKPKHLAPGLLAFMTIFAPTTCA